MSHLDAIKHKLPFSFVQVIPGTVIGPSELINTASEAYEKMDRMSKALLFNEVKPRYAFGFVHVDDCATVHVEALDEGKLPSSEIPGWLVAAASNEPGGTIQETWQTVGTMIETEFPDQVKEGVFKVAKRNLPINMPYRVDSGWTEDRLLQGRRFRKFEDCVRTVAEWYATLVMHGA
jgi:nucleoside-diphosphate-sugar epimerase